MSRITPTLKMLTAKRDQIVALAEQHGAFNVRVFGSVARGDSPPDSDVDVLVTFHPNRNIFDQVGL